MNFPPFEVLLLLARSSLWHLTLELTGDSCPLRECVPLKSRLRRFGRHPLNKRVFYFFHELSALE